MIVLFRRLMRPDPVADTTGADEARAFLAEPPAPMPAVRPPEAVNADPLRPVYAEVERELRLAGHLR